MPTPYGSRGGMAFGAEELRVLRRALALALHPSPVRDRDRDSGRDEDVQDLLRLAESVDEAMREGARLRAFLVADLARYRTALPGTASGYLALLDDVLATGYQPGPDDLAALRALRGNPAAAALLDRCRALAEQSLRARLARRAVPIPAPAAAPGSRSRTRLLALPGGRDGKARPPEPPRPVPTPAEVFPPKRRPGTPETPETPERPGPTPADPPHQLVAG
ncbi:hypothetical protein [Streptomyces sp. NPDC029674]|uniref:hypothetical protein n=1 Tax=Streptomyces sp. NPDC029674 TaxID=3365297 RepID=UPI00384DDFEB